MTKEFPNDSMTGFVPLTVQFALLSYRCGKLGHSCFVILSSLALRHSSLSVRLPFGGLGYQINLPGEETWPQYV
jgi:hypothetical protein